MCYFGARRPAEVEALSSRTGKGAKGGVAYRQRIASLARLARKAIPSSVPSRRWRLGRLGEERGRAVPP